MPKKIVLVSKCTTAYLINLNQGLGNISEKVIYLKFLIFQKTTGPGIQVAVWLFISSGNIVS